MRNNLALEIYCPEFEANASAPFLIEAHKTGILYITKAKHLYVKMVCWR